jgi:hypothetical protein
MDQMDVSKTNEGSQNTSEEISKPTLEELHDHLDSLWTAYLNYLDAYASAQKLLQKHMSAGFLSLARANFNSRDHIRRYGRDYYHEHAIATRRAIISVDNATSKPSLEIAQWSPSATESEIDSEAPVEVEKTGENEEDVKQLPSPPGTPEAEPHQSDSDQDTTPSEKETRVPLPSDPLKWFGILVPQALRSSQASFCAAVDEAVADAANAAKGTRSTEAEIRKLRKEIRRAEKETSAHV